MKKTTLQDMRDILVNSPDGSDRHFWGVVTRKNTNAAGKVTSYEVALGGNEGTMTCRKLAGADVGDTVMVTLQKNGAATVTGTVDGDKDAENALTAATSAQQTAEDLEDLVGDGDESGITITTQYYLSTSNTEPTGGAWSDTLPTYVDGRYYWTKTVTTYADGSEIESDPILDIASQMTAETNAVATATDQHFWSDSSGAYVTKTNKSLTSGYAMKITTNGLLQTYNGNNLMSLTSSGLTLYQSNGSTMMASYSSTGCYLYGNGTLGAAITSSGATIYGGSSSYRTEMTDSGLKVYYNSSLTTKIGASVEFYKGGSRTANIVQQSDGTGVIFNLNGNQNCYISAAVGNTYIGSNGYIYLNSPVQSSTITSSDAITASGKITGGSLSISGNATVNKLYVSTPGTASSSTANCRIATGESNRIMFTSSGSTRKIKHEIQPINDDALDPHKLYDAEVVQFIYNDDFLNAKDCRYGKPLAGFIAEDLLDVYPTAVDVEDGEAKDWNYRYIIPPMLALIQELNERVKLLERRS